MKLALDIGNTQIKFGVFNKEDLVYSSYFKDSENIVNKFKKIKQFNPEICIISSVVPSLTLKYDFNSIIGKNSMSYYTYNIFKSKFN